MDPFVSILVTEDVADACRRGEPVLETVTEVAIGAFRDLGIDPLTNPPQLDSIERDEDEYGEFWKVNFRIPKQEGGAVEISRRKSPKTTPPVSLAREVILGVKTDKNND